MYVEKTRDLGFEILIRVVGSHKGEGFDTRMKRKKHRRKTIKPIWGMTRLGHGQVRSRLKLDQFLKP